MAHEGGNLQNEVIREEHHHPLYARRVIVLDGDGNQITDFGGVGGSGTAAYSDSGGTDKKGLVDADRHVQTDVLSSALPTGAATSAKQDTIIGHLDGVETALADITTPADTQPVSHAALTELAAAIDTEVQVDVVGALPPGTNAIGKLSANSGVDIGDVDVTSSVASSFDHGSNRDIDTSAEQITSSSVTAKFGVLLKASDSNTGIIYVGNSDVTAGTTDATDGFPLAAGDSVLLKVNNANIPYAIGSANNQVIYWMTV